MREKTLEFKESTQSLSNIIKTVIAFANTAGGIIIGIQDRTKKVIGVEKALDEEEPPYQWDLKFNSHL